MTRPSDTVDREAELVEDKRQQVNVRLTATLVEQLTAIAEVEDTTVTQLAREALEALVEQRRNDPTWRERRRAKLAEERARLDALMDSI